MSDSLRKVFILGCAAAGFVGIGAALIHFDIINGYYAQILTMAGVNALMAISVNVVVGITGQLSIGQAGFMAIGAYTCVFMTADLGLPLPLGIFIAAGLTALAGILIGFPTLQLSGDYLAIVTLGFGEIIRVLLTNLKEFSGGANGKSFSTIINQDIVSGGLIAFVITTGTLILTVTFLRNFLHSSYGRAIAAVREDEIAANSSGISVFRYKMTGFVIAAFIAGLAGSLYVTNLGFVQPELASYTRSIDYLIYVVLGGMGSMTGSIISAYVLYFLQELLRFLKDYRLLIYPVILIFVMLFRPQGLLGTGEISFIKLYEKGSQKLKLILQSRRVNSSN